VSSGDLPPGLTLFTSGTLAGTPTAEGDFTFVIQAKDRNGCIGTRQYVLVIKCPLINIHPTTLPEGTVGKSYHKMINANGGNNPYSFTVVDGVVPPGLTLFSSGTFAGTPTTEGTFNFTVQAKDSFGCTAQQDYTVMIKCPTITVKPFNLPSGTVNQPYNRTLNANGGNSPYTFVIETGNLPNGLTLSANGVISGTPTLQGSFTFTAMAVDNFGCTGKRSYTIIITPIAVPNMVAPGPTVF